eukprot:TRINITY_DN18063_c0_g1_i2.p1 TRINITY_DN18063_c0_g1~~TRINITY_DN18063_c0_g1_i2.p1  ORF type:complete len:522 (-),score=128.95 TRINITY_DN18063_c0_g1_i2:397-1962(-)
MQRLHNKKDPCYSQERAGLFTRYLEDHTGLQKNSHSGAFEEMRVHYEDATFNWNECQFKPSTIARRPYVVMELVKGRLLQQTFEGQPPLEVREKRAIVAACAKALVYMERFKVIHRDFRGCNIFCVGGGSQTSIKVIDLGFMVSTERSQAKNPNPAVRCAWQGDPARKLRFDWAPPEVRQRGSPNWAVPAHSFDVYSFGVLILKLLRGRDWTQEALIDPNRDLTRTQVESLGVESLGLSVDLVQRMVDQKQPTNRPSPEEILQHVMHRGCDPLQRLRSNPAPDGQRQQASSRTTPAASGSNGQAADEPTAQWGGGQEEEPESDLYPPQVLYLTTPVKHRECDGVYRLVPGQLPNGHALWKKEDANRWLYSSLSGKWHIGTSHENAKNFACSSGWIFHNTQHHGVLPNKMDGLWSSYDSDSKTWKQDKSIRVAVTPAAAGGGAAPAAAVATTATAPPAKKVESTSMPLNGKSTAYAAADMVAGTARGSYANGVENGLGASGVGSSKRPPEKQMSRNTKRQRT